MPSYLRCRYVVDRIVAAIALVLLSPVLGLLALWVLCVDGRPVLYRSERVVAGKRVALIPKIRTFTRSHHPDSLRERGDAAFSSVDGSPDLLRGARLVRALGLDELPQLMSVVRGEMAIIGPRVQPPEYSRLNDPRPEWLRPGIISPAVAAGRRTLTIEQRLALDLEYIDGASPLLDLRTIIRTIAAIAMRVE